MADVILVFPTKRARLPEDDAYWIYTSWADADVAFRERLGPKLKAAVEAKQETEIVVDEEMRQDLVAIFERIEATGRMTDTLRAIQKTAAPPIT